MEVLATFEVKSSRVQSTKDESKKMEVKNLSMKENTNLPSKLKIEVDDRLQISTKRNRERRKVFELDIRVKGTGPAKKDQLTCETL